MSGTEIKLRGTKLNIFCSWGNGPDVGIDITQDEDVRKTFTNPCFTPLDFTITEAKDVVVALNKAIAQAEEIDQSYRDYIANEQAEINENRQ